MSRPVTSTIHKSKNFLQFYPEGTSNEMIKLPVTAAISTLLFKPAIYSTSNASQTKTYQLHADEKGPMWYIVAPTFYWSDVPPVIQITAKYIFLQY